MKHSTSIPSDAVAKIRDASRLMVRELGLIGSLYGRVLPSNTQCHVMIELARHQQLQPQELARILCIDKSTLSRVLSIMHRDGWIRTKPHPTRKTGKLIELTARGATELARVNTHANTRVQEALATVRAADVPARIDGMASYARALQKARLLKSAVIRPIRRSDDQALSEIIRTVMPEFGAGGEGFAIHDPEVSHMSRAFRAPGSAYFVIDVDGLIMGGGGIAPLRGGEGRTCEIQKMYFRPELRGLGLGRKLLAQVLDKAKQLRYSTVYLETLRSMQAANHLYEEFGFRDSPTPLGNTGHCGCDRWMVKLI